MLTLSGVKPVNIVQIVLGVLVLALLICTVAFAKFVKQKSITLGAGANGLYEELSKIDTQGSLPGAQAMQGARTFLEEGDYTQAREKLLFITNFYSEASFASQARKILGEMNLDQLFSPSYNKNKEVYTIKSGDSLSRIAKKYECTIEFIMALNNLTYPDRIQPGQEITVMPLKTRTIINTSKKTLTVFLDDQFLTEYPIKEILISSRAKPMTTKVERLLGYDQSKTYPMVSSKFRQKKKLVILREGNLQIRAIKHPDEPDPGAGFFLDTNDLEEFALLVKIGDEVEIQL